MAKKKKCKYYREQANENYVPSCTGDYNHIHRFAIEGTHCKFCGRKIKYKEFAEVPEKLRRR